MVIWEITDLFRASFWLQSFEKTKKRFLNGKIIWMFKRLSFNDSKKTQMIFCSFESIFCASASIYGTAAVIWSTRLGTGLKALNVFSFKSFFERSLSLSSESASQQSFWSLQVRPDCPASKEPLVSLASRDVKGCEALAECTEWPAVKVKRDFEHSYSNSKFDY